MRDYKNTIKVITGALTQARDNEVDRVEFLEEIASEVDELAELLLLTQTGQVKIVKTQPATVPFDDVPDEWLDRCSGEGHERTIDDKGNKVYTDTGNIVQEEGWRPCAKCGEFPTDEGHDHCIQNLGSVINACCGHGKNKGYIMFDDGRLIEGDFTITNLWEDSDGEK